MMLQRQLNVILKRISEIDNTENTGNKTKILKVSSNDEYYTINNIMKLQKVIDTTSTKWINERMKKFRRLSISYSNCIKKCLNQIQKTITMIKLNKFWTKYLKNLKLWLVHRVIAKRKNSTRKWNIMSNFSKKL